MTDAGRLARVRAIARAAGMDGVLVTRTAGKRWLSGFMLGAGEEPTSGWSGTLLVTEAAQLVLADPRYTEQAEHECPGWEVRRTRGLIGEGLPPSATGIASSTYCEKPWNALRT